MVLAVTIAHPTTVMLIAFLASFVDPETRRARVPSSSIRFFFHPAVKSLYQIVESSTWVVWGGMQTWTRAVGDELAGSAR